MSARAAEMSVTNNSQKITSNRDWSLDLLHSSMMFSYLSEVGIARTTETSNIAFNHALLTLANILVQMSNGSPTALAKLTPSCSLHTGMEEVPRSIPTEGNCIAGFIFAIPYPIH